MEYRRLGKNGVFVSPLCLGTMNYGWHTSEKDSHTLMDQALSESGMSRSEYLVLLREAYAYIADAELIGQLQEFEQVLAQCP